jgi:hypothetical protein
VGLAVLGGISSKRPLDVWKLILHETPSRQGFNADLSLIRNDVSFIVRYYSLRPTTYPFAGNSHPSIISSYLA